MATLVSITLVIPFTLKILLGYPKMQHLMRPMQLFVRLGFVPHPSKSVFQPTQVLEFMWFFLNSITITVLLRPRTLQNNCSL